MTKKWLMYVVTGLICCSVIAFAAATKTSRTMPSKAASANATLHNLDKALQMNGSDSNLLKQKEAIQSNLKAMAGQPGAVKVIENAPSAGSEVVASEKVTVASRDNQTAQLSRDEVRAMLSNKAEGAVLNPSLTQERDALLAEIADLQANGRDYTAEKTRFNEITAQMAPSAPRRSLDQGGETCVDAPAIASLPYCDQGTTVGALNDYPDGPGPEVVYSYTPAVTENIIISLCGNSGYDTRLLVYSGGCPDAGGSLIFNNDDWCGLQSCSESFGTLTVSAGVIYYILVDAFSSGTGPYTLKVEVDAAQGCSTTPVCAGAIGRCCYGSEFLTCDDVTETDCVTLGGIWNAFANCIDNPCPNCNVTCGPNDILEVFEADTCILPASDPNGGCNNESGIFTFTDLACGDTACAEAFTYLECTQGLQYRDLDWYRFTTTVPSIMSVSVRAAFDNAVVYFIGGDCVTQPFYGSASAAGCGEVFTFTSACLPAGDYFFVVGLNAFTGLPYGGLNNGYRAWVDCTPCEVPTGRCCYYDLGTPACATNFEIECGNLGGLWTEGENCVDQPCAFGACCYNDGLCCDELFDFDCAALGGVFNGVGTLCQTVECTRTCSVTPGVTDIIEPLEADSCGFTFVDPNGGCNNTVPSFTQMACGDTVAGISYYYCDGGGFPLYRDTDWYEFTITQAQDVSVSAIADVSGYLVGIIAAPCPNGSFTALAFDAGCGTVATATALCLPAGTYYAWFGLIGNTCTSFADPAQYRLWVDCAPATNCPIGRCCYDGGLSCADNTSDECLTLGGDWDGSTNCAAGPCPVPVDNDDCENAEVIVTVNNGSVTTASGAEGATFTCAGPVCGDLCTFSGSTSIDQFYTFTLTECRLLAIVGDGPSAFACDPALAVYPDGECCGVADACNDDWGCNGDLDILPWLPPVLRPVANYGSMIADSFGPGTYYIRAGHFGASWNGIYDLTIYDFGPCVIAPCDPVVDLTIFIETAASQPTNVKLFWTAPQTDDYKVWATTNPMNDGNPDDGADADFTLVATILGVPAGPTSWQAPAGFAGLPPVGGPTFYVVTAVCEPFVEPTGRCCYEDLCADVTAAECANLAGTWDQFLTCADPCPLTGGETINDAIPVNALPFSASGNTCTYVNDYDETCPYSGSLSPDVVFAFAPGANTTINLSLCVGTTDYDTKMYIYENAVTPGLPYACNDDACSSPLFLNYVSQLLGVAVTGGNTYYIVVDGYGSACGNYTLDITE